MLLIYISTLLAKNDCLNILVVVRLQSGVSGACIIYIVFSRNGIVYDSSYNDGSYNLLSIYNVPAAELKMLLMFSFNLHNTPYETNTVSILCKRTEFRVVK